MEWNSVIMMLFSVVVGTFLKEVFIRLPREVDFAIEGVTEYEKKYYKYSLLSLYIKRYMLKYLFVIIVLYTLWVFMAWTYLNKIVCLNNINSPFIILDQYHPAFSSFIAFLIHIIIILDIGLSLFFPYWFAWEFTFKYLSIQAAKDTNISNIKIERHQSEMKTRIKLAKIVFFFLLIPFILLIE